MPWDWMECLKSTDVTRVPSLSMVHSLMNLHAQKNEDIDVSKCTFVLNPDGSLKNVQDRLSNYFTSRSSWTGFIQAKPNAEEVERILQEKDLML